MNVFLQMRNFTIRFRMISAIVLVLSFLSLLGGVGLFGMYRISSLSQDFRSQSMEALQSQGDLRAELGRVRMYEKDMIIHYESPEGVRKSLKLWQESVERTLALEHAMTREAEGDTKVIADKMVAAMTAYRDQFMNVARQLEASGYDTATVANRTSTRAIERFDEANQLRKQLEDLLKKDAEATAEKMDRLVAQTKVFFIVAVLVCILVVVPLTILNMNMICRPLEHARQTAQNIAKGDLSRLIEVRGKDEVADLQDALAQMQSSLGAMVAQVRGASENIATASQEIAMGNQDLSGRTEQTASHVQDTASSIGELMGHVHQTASAAQQANQLAASASQAAARGGNVVQQAVSSMHEISASSHKISDIIGLIDTIAFQTNILALNAAVEAARAGEQGRGFAVVAGEVRSLAQRAAQAASEIKGLINNSVQAVEGGVRQVEEAGRAMTEIMGGVQRVTDIIGEISSAASEQSSGIGNVSQSVNEIDRMTQQNAALVEQSAAASESLREQATRLATVVQQFQLADALNVSRPAGLLPR